jgi:flavin-dependent dehydrogenase
MLVTGPGGVKVDARYPGNIRGRAIVRRELDLALLQGAADAGAEVEEEVLVQKPLLDSRRQRVIGGDTMDRQLRCLLDS